MGGPIQSVTSWHGHSCCPETSPAALLGSASHQDLVRMLVNSLFWTVLGVIVVVLAI